MSFGEEAFKYAKSFRSTIEVVAAIVGCMVYLNVWWSDQVVSKKEFLMGITEVQLKIVESDLRDYQRTGLANLSEQEKFQYELLVKAQEKLTDSRNQLLGLSQ